MIWKIPLALVIQVREGLGWEGQPGSGLDLQSAPAFAVAFQQNSLGLSSHMGMRILPGSSLSIAHPSGQAPPTPILGHGSHAAIVQRTWPVLVPAGSSQRNSDGPFLLPWRWGWLHAALVCSSPAVTRLTNYHICPPHTHTHKHPHHQGGWLGHGCKGLVFCSICSHGPGSRVVWWRGSLEESPVVAESDKSLVLPAACTS